MTETGSSFCRRLPPLEALLIAMSLVVPTARGNALCVRSLDTGAERVFLDEFAKLGVRDYIIKPFTEQMIVERVGRVIDLQQKGAGAAKITLQGIRQLGTDQMAQGVGGEIAEQPFGPVDVLQAALGVVGRLDAKQCHHAPIPLHRQLLHRHVLSDELSQTTSERAMRRRAGRR